MTFDLDFQFPQKNKDLCKKEEEKTKRKVLEKKEIKKNFLFLKKIKFNNQ